MTELVLEILEMAFECFRYVAIVKIICEAFVIQGRIFTRRVD